MMTSMTRAEVEKIVAEARAENKTPNLQGANLRFVDLCGADLRGANLYNCIWDGLQITQFPYGQVILTPTCKGWWMSTGCWDGTPEELKTLISKDEGGIEADDQNHLPCSYLETVFALCEVHMADNAKVIDDLKAKWGGDGEK